MTKIALVETLRAAIGARSQNALHSSSKAPSGWAGVGIPDVQCNIKSD